MADDPWTPVAQNPLTWEWVEPEPCVWTPFVYPGQIGELDFSDPDNSGLLPEL